MKHPPNRPELPCFGQSITIYLDVTNFGVGRWAAEAADLAIDMFREDGDRQGQDGGKSSRNDEKHRNRFGDWWKSRRWSIRIYSTINIPNDSTIEWWNWIQQNSRVLVMSRKNRLTLIQLKSADSWWHQYRWCSCWWWIKVAPIFLWWIHCRKWVVSPVVWCVGNSPDNDDYSNAKISHKN